MSVLKDKECACQQRAVWAFGLPLQRPWGGAQPLPVRRALLLPQFFGPRVPGPCSASDHLIFALLSCSSQDHFTQGQCRGL